VPVGRPAVFSRYNSGPKTLPWGTPALTRVSSVYSDSKVNFDFHFCTFLSSAVGHANRHRVVPLLVYVLASIVLIVITFWVAQDVFFYLNNATRCLQNVTKTSSYKVTICFNLTL
jgi:hypothetical protein